MSGAVARMPPAPSAMGRQHGLRSETGYVRKANEDQLGFRRVAAGEIYVVSDGMGGYRGGALAARETVKSLLETLGKARRSEELPSLMGEAFRVANKAVFDKRHPDDPETREMGATAVAVFVTGQKAIVGHVGDSRAYRWSEGGGLRALTKDHSRVQQMIDNKIISAEDAANHPDASVLARAIGHQANVDADVSGWISLRNGERLILCSDGLSGYANDSEIDLALRSAEDPQAQTDKLIELALTKGGEDNVTVQVVKVTGGSTRLIERIFSPTSSFIVFTAAFLSLVWWTASLQSRTDSTLKRMEQSINDGSRRTGQSDAAQVMPKLQALEAQVVMLQKRFEERPATVEQNPVARPAPKPAASRPEAKSNVPKGASASANNPAAKASEPKQPGKKNSDASADSQTDAARDLGQPGEANRSKGNVETTTTQASDPNASGAGK